MAEDRVLDQINAWREDLINLNRNNRLLYFRKTKSSTLELRLPIATELLGRLSNGRGVTFWEPPDDIERESQGDLEQFDESLALFEQAAAVPRNAWDHNRRPVRYASAAPRRRAMKSYATSQLANRC